MDFAPFPKLARWSRTVTVTEKIDGTNACVWIGSRDESDANSKFDAPVLRALDLQQPGGLWKREWLAIRAGSRSRWITPEDDNYGFAAWVHANASSLFALGGGQHFGEWWGAGIQRRYGLSEKRFSLFNNARWSGADKRPTCCGVVPVLYHGPLTDGFADDCLTQLRVNGSVAAPGFMDPEGIVLYHSAAGVSFKKTIKADESPKSVAEKQLATA